MSDSGIQAWQLSLIVTLLIVAVEPLVHLLLSRRPNLVVSRWFRTTALALLVILTVVVAVAALGPDLADKLSSVAAGVVALVAFVLALRSYQSQSLPPSGTGAPEEPTPPPSVEPSPAPPAAGPAASPPAVSPGPPTALSPGPAGGPPTALSPGPAGGGPAGGGPAGGGPDVPPLTRASNGRATNDRQPFLPLLIRRLLAGRKTPRR
ncbi:hypothetical protein ACIA5D_40875 [Actinoplanes sp. NPDC051513]|uniref:hypothetical protein n=1 Tax=Actinoplanes sp. NPDC051513 TaxID=3363908 RepID=UPI0037B4CA56